MLTVSHLWMADSVTACSEFSDSSQCVPKPYLLYMNSVMDATITVVAACQSLNASLILIVLPIRWVNVRISEFQIFS